MRLGFWKGGERENEKERRGKRTQRVCERQPVDPRRTRGRPQVSVPPRRPADRRLLPAHVVGVGYRLSHCDALRRRHHLAPSPGSSSTGGRDAGHGGDGLGRVAADRAGRDLEADDHKSRVFFLAVVSFVDSSAASLREAPGAPSSPLLADPEVGHRVDQSLVTLPLLLLLSFFGRAPPPTAGYRLLDAPQKGGPRAHAVDQHFQLDVVVDEGRHRVAPALGPLGDEAEREPRDHRAPGGDSGAAVSGAAPSIHFLEVEGRDR